MRDRHSVADRRGSLALAAGAPRPGTVPPAPPTATIPFVFDDGRVFIPVGSHTIPPNGSSSIPASPKRRSTPARPRGSVSPRRTPARSRVPARTEMHAGRAAAIAVSVGGVSLSPPFICRRPARFAALSVLGYPRTRRDRRTVLRRACRGAGLRHTHDAGLRTVHVRVPRPGCHPAAHVHGHRAGCHRHAHATKRRSQANAAPRRPRCQGEPSRYRAVHPRQRDPRCVPTAHADGTRVRGRRRDPIRLRPRPLTRTRPARGQRRCATSSPVSPSKARCDRTSTTPCSAPSSSAGTS